MSAFQQTQNTVDTWISQVKSLKEIASGRSKQVLYASIQACWELRPYMPLVLKRLPVTKETFDRLCKAYETCVAIEQVNTPLPERLDTLFMIEALVHQLQRSPESVWQRMLAYGVSQGTQELVWTPKVLKHVFEPEAARLSF